MKPDVGSNGMVRLMPRIDRLTSHKMKTKTIITVVSLFFLQVGLSQETATFFTKADTFFATYIQNGRIDYQGIKADPSSLEALLELGQHIEVSETDAATYQSFWINGYNLLVIKGIIDNYPVKSPLDINGFFDTTKRSFGGRETTLNDIENKLLRAKFPEEARFHFVLVCAGLGCPPIVNEAYVPAKLEGQLQRQTELSLNNPSFIRSKGKKVLLSQIFEWYKEDFTRNGATEIEFVNRYRKEKFDPSAKIGYYSYDWALNEIK